MTTPDPTSPSRGRSRTTTAALVAVALVVLALYALVLNAYAQSARIAERPELPETNGVSVYFEPYAIRPAERLIDSYVTVVPPASLITENGRLSQDIILTLTSDIGSSVITFEGGSPAIALNKEESAPISNGSYATYPLDAYDVKFDLIAIAENAGTSTWLPAQATVWGDVPGWKMGPQNFLVPSNTPTDTDTPLPDGSPTSVEISADRAGSTVTIVALLLIAMMSATLLALTVAVSIWKGKRRAEPSLASWGAALLFAMVPLRLNMPDAPPIGVWLDFLVFLWVLLLLLVALAGIVAGWLKNGAPPEPVRHDGKKDPVTT